MQPSIVIDTIERLETRPDLKALVKGFMVESFLKDGNQAVNLQQPTTLDLTGLSITDPCLSWDETEELLLKLASMGSSR